MFTGLVTHSGEILSAAKKGDLRLAVSCPWNDLAVGESVAVNGVCLTVVKKFPLPLREGGRGRGISGNISQHMPPSQPSPSRGEGFMVTLSAETVKRTARRWKAGEAVNLERALRMGDDVGGHFVTGHVDGVAKIIDIASPPLIPPRKRGGRIPIPPACGGDVRGGGNHSRILCLEVPKDLAKFIAPKGSVSLDGVSLTVNKVEGRTFWVNIIPHTWKATTLGRRRAGDGLNLEIDVIARYVARLMEKKK